MIKSTNIKYTISHTLFALIGISLFLIPLLHAWMGYPFAIESPHTNYSALGGLLPQSDADGYFRGAYRLLDSGSLDAWNTRRPLNAILLAVRLWISNNHFKLALLLQAILCGFSCLLVASSIAKTFGKVSGSVTFLILFLFEAVFVPTTLSETLGLTLGSFAFVLLWEGIQRKHILVLSFGTLILTIGLNARAGAFFVLPLLILWIAFTLNWRAAIITLIGALGGFIFNAVLIVFYSADNGGIIHSNFAFTLFGLVAGGQGWDYAYKLYPELLNQSEGAAASFLYEKSFMLFSQNPFWLFLGLLKGMLGLLKGLISFFQYKLPSHFLLKATIRSSGILLYCISIYRLNVLYPRYRFEIGLIGIGLLGMFLSSSVLWVDGGFRVFATTVPFFAAACGIAFGSFFLSGYSKTFLEPSNRFYHQKIQNTETKVTAFASTFLLFVALVGPYLIHNISSEQQPSINLVNLTCAPGESLIITKKISHAPHIALPPPLPSATLYKNSILRNIMDTEDKESFLRILEPDILNQPKTLSLIYDFNTKESKYILAPSALFLEVQQTVGLCGTAIPGAKSITDIKSFEVIHE